MKYEELIEEASKYISLLYPNERCNIAYSDKQTFLTMNTDMSHAIQDSLSNGLSSATGLTIVITGYQCAFGGAKIAKLSVSSLNSFIRRSRNNPKTCVHPMRGKTYKFHKEHDTGRCTFFKDTVYHCLTSGSGWDDHCLMLLVDKGVVLSYDPYNEPALPMHELDKETESLKEEYVVGEVIRYKSAEYMVSKLTSMYNFTEMTLSNANDEITFIPIEDVVEFERVSPASETEKINERLVEYAVAKVYCEVRKIQDFTGTFNQVREVFANVCDNSHFEAVEYIVKNANIEVTTELLSALELKLEELKKAVSFDEETLRSVPEEREGRISFIIEDGIRATVSRIKGNERDIIRWSDMIEVEKIILNASKTLEALVKEQAVRDTIVAKLK